MFPPTTEPEMFPPQEGITLPEDNIPAEVNEPFDEEEIHGFFIKIGERFDQDDLQFRHNQIIELKKLSLYWDGAQRLFMDPNSDNWVDANGLHTPSQRAQYDPALVGSSDRVINIYRPHGESIIAAMSVGTPTVQFFPEDADNANDITTAKSYSKISELLQRRNNATLLFIKTLFTFYNQGIVFGYNYTHQDSKYGTYEAGEKTEQVKQIETGLNPDTGEAVEIETFVPQVVGKIIENKVSECIEIYGALHVQVPSWCRKPEDVPILTLKLEQHESVIRHAYPDMYDKIRGGIYAYEDSQERNARLKPNTNLEDTLCTLTIRWITPVAYCEMHQDIAEFLESKYPKGVKIVCLGKVVLELIEENLHDHWTICYPIFSESIYQKPQGSQIVDIQEIRNDVITNADEMFRAAIPETFVDPDVLDFDAYQQTPRRPGQRFPAKAKSGKTLSEGFHSEKPASLNQELDIFIKRLDADAQFTSGAFPSIFGGPATTGSKTAAEYEQSRAQALQRLSTYWKMLSFFWVGLWGRSTVQHARNLVEAKYDEREVVKKGGTFKNIFIKWSELEGKVGKIEPEASENFPISPAQKKALILGMLELKNPVIERLMYHPENAQVILEIIGMPDIYLPGADDRTKQIREIGELLKSGPTSEQESSVPPDPDADDNPVHIQICRAWMVSDIGQYEKAHNPDGYLNVATHLRQHKFLETQQTMEPNDTPAGQPPMTNATGPV